MPGFSGVAPLPTGRVVHETRLCGGCATLLTRRPDGTWVHAILVISGHEPSPWGEPITSGTISESEARLLDGNR